MLTSAPVAMLLVVFGPGVLYVWPLLLCWPVDSGSIVVIPRGIGISDGPHLLLMTQYLFITDIPLLTIVLIPLLLLVTNGVVGIDCWLCVDC